MQIFQYSNASPNTALLNLLPRGIPVCSMTENTSPSPAADGYDCEHLPRASVLLLNVGLWGRKGGDSKGVTFAHRKIGGSTSVQEKLLPGPPTTSAVCAHKPG